MYLRSLNIFKIIEYIKHFWLGSMISILFLKFVGFSDMEISLFHIIMSFLIFFLEIPTGVFADKYGYKKSLVIGNGAMALAFLCFVLASFHGKGFILIGTALFFSLSNSFYSGASQSYIYVLHKHDKKERDYVNFFSKLKQKTSWLEGLAIILGAALYIQNPLLPYGLQFILVSFAFLLTLTLAKEPQLKSNKQSIKKTLFQSLKIFRNNRYFFLLVCYIVLVTAGFEFFHHIINQSLFVQEGFSVLQIGFIGLFSWFFAGILVGFTDRLYNYFGERNMHIFFAFYSLIIPIGFLLDNTLVSIMLFTGLFYFLRQGINILVDNGVQKRAENQYRATIASIVSMLSRLPTRLLFLLFTLTLSSYSYKLSLNIVTGIFGILAITFSLIFFRKSKNFFK